MSALGDQLRQLAEEADAWPDLVAMAALVTKTTALRAHCDAPDDEDQARLLALNLLVNLVRA